MKLATKATFLLFLPALLVFGAEKFEKPFWQVALWNESGMRAIDTESNQRISVHR